jgi:hypothetical protein
MGLPYLKGFLYIIMFIFVFIVCMFNISKDKGLILNIKRLFYLISIESDKKWYHILPWINMCCIYIFLL